MNEVNLKRIELLDIVRQNRLKHIEKYKQAKLDYEEEVLSVAYENINIAKLIRKDLIGGKKVSQVKKFLSYPALPSSYEDHYNKAIRMLELSCDETISLESNLFNQLVLDEWAWKNQFETMTTSFRKYA